jgi:hypothetical protein
LACEDFPACLSQIATAAPDIDLFLKLLKIKTFISEKSLDTSVFRLIRFRQKVLTGSKAPLELFSLEEEAAQLPGGLFVFSPVQVLHFAG